VNTAGSEGDEALALAVRALSLGDGLLAQSICLDRIESDTTSEAVRARAVSLLVQAVALSGSALTGVEPRALLSSVPQGAERAFLEGLLAYQRARALAEEGVPDFVRTRWLQTALEHFQGAVQLEPGHGEAAAYLSLMRRLTKA
jgi:hypothetical protein